MAVLDYTALAVCYNLPFYVGMDDFFVIPHDAIHYCHVL